MNRQRKTASAVAAVSVLSLSLAGCASGAGPAAEGGESTINYVIWDANALEPYKDVIAAFNEEHPEITVNIQALPWDQYWTKLQTQASSKTLPDVFWINEPNAGLYATNGALAAIDTAQGFDPANFPAASIQSYTFDDELYAAPTGYSTMGVWYNTDLFDRAGVDYPADGWTQEDFVAAATAISDALGSEGVFGAAAAPWTGQETSYNTIYQSGGEVISADGTTSGYDDPGTIAGVKLWVDLAQAGVSPSVAQITDTPIPQYFTSGKLAMMWSGPWNANSLKDSEIAETVAVAPLPTGESDLVTTIQGGADAVSAYSENKEAAQTFQAFLGSKKAQEMYGAAGLGIPAYNGVASSFTDAFPQWDLSLFSDQAEHAAPYPVSLNTAAWNTLENEYLTKAWSGELTVEEACKQLAAAMNEVLAAEQK